MTAKQPSIGSWRILTVYDNGTVIHWTCNDHEVAEQRVRDRFKRDCSSSYGKAHTAFVGIYECVGGAEAWVLRACASPRVEPVVDPPSTEKRPAELLVWARWCATTVEAVQAAKWPGAELVCVVLDADNSTNRQACWAYLRGSATVRAAYVNHGEAQRPRWTTIIG